MRRIFEDLQQLVMESVRWLLAGSGEIQCTIPVSLANPPRRTRFRHVSIFRLRRGEQNTRDGMRTQRRSLTFPV